MKGQTVNTIFVRSDYYINPFTSLLRTYHLLLCDWWLLTPAFKLNLIQMVWSNVILKASTVTYINDSHKYTVLKIIT